VVERGGRAWGQAITVANWYSTHNRFAANWWMARESLQSAFNAACSECLFTINGQCKLSHY